jgi:Fe-S cluster assembly iron-binding protein IscA
MESTVVSHVSFTSGAVKELNRLLAQKGDEIKMILIGVKGGG